jgi:hypothetical protein
MIALLTTSALAQVSGAGEPKPGRKPLTERVSMHETQIAALEAKTGNAQALIYAVSGIVGLWLLLGVIERVCSRSNRELDKLTVQLETEKSTTGLLTKLLESRKPESELIEQLKLLLAASNQARADGERQASALQRAIARIEQLEKALER